MNANLLHVVAVMSNPMRWQSRLALYKQFEQHMLDSGVQLTTVECVLGNRPFVLDNPHVQHVQVRHHTILWNKENLINLGVQRLPHDWQYVAWIDADVLMRQPGWAANTVHALQQYEVIQPWETCYDLGPHGEHLALHKSFLSLWWNKKPIVQGPKCSPGGYEFGHPGYAWACTRRAYDWLGGLVETAALGAGDHHMALAFIDKVNDTIPGGVTPGYRTPLVQWQERAIRHVNYSLGYVHGSTIEHQWHGRKDDRQYIPRWSIVVNNKFDPAVDTKRNTYGVLELAGNKPMLARDLDIYFHQRNEDGNLI